MFNEQEGAAVIPHAGLERLDDEWEERQVHLAAVRGYDDVGIGSKKYVDLYVADNYVDC